MSSNLVNEPSCCKSVMFCGIHVQGVGNSKAVFELPSYLLKFSVRFVFVKVLCYFIGSLG